MSRCHSRRVKTILSAHFPRDDVSEIGLRFCTLVGGLHCLGMNTIVVCFYCCESLPSFQASFIMTSIGSFNVFPLKVKGYSFPTKDFVVVLIFRSRHFIIELISIFLIHGERVWILRFNKFL